MMDVLDIMSASRIDGGSVTLNEDLTKEILLKTPFEGLTRCKYVSKSWGNWLSKSEFHHQYTGRNESKSNVVFPASPKDNQGRKSLFSLDCDHPQATVFMRKIPFYALNMFIVASYMGLVCLSDSCRETSVRSMLWNPLTGEGKVIEYPPRRLMRGQDVAIGFGYDGYDFKIIRLSPANSLSILNPKHNSTLVEIFSVEQNVWKDFEIKTRFIPLKENNSFIIDGIPYWEGADHCYSCYLLWFDTRNNNYGQIPYPVIDEVGDSRMTMFCIHEKIVAISTDTPNQYVRSYNLEADGSWSKGFTVGPFHFFSNKVYAAVSNGGMILCSNLYNGTEFLDVINNVLVPVSEPETFAADWLQAIPYEETLVGFGPGTMVLSEENLVRMDGSSKSLVEDIYNDLASRRNALIKALTKDVDRFRSCLDADAEQQCLYGFTDGHWEVKIPDDRFGLGFPHPRPVTYLDRHLKDENYWLAHVSIESQSWLSSIAEYYISELGLDVKERDKLQGMLLVLPPLDEATGYAMPPTEDDEEYIDFA